MVIFPLLVFLLRSILSSGAPVTPNLDTTVSARDDSVPLLPTADRSTLEIIWTCAAIIFASSWVCIHPHVPGFKQKRRHRWGIRLRLFVNALLFPDQFVGRACYEWAGSRALYKEMERRLAEMLRRPSGVDAEVSKAAEGKMRELAKETTAFLDEVESEQTGKDIQAVKAVAIRNEEAAVEAKRTGQTVVKVALSPAEQEATERVQKLRTRRRHMEIDFGRAQRLMAQELVEEETEPIFPKLKKNDWTMVHAHFIHMGGVVFQGPDNKMRFKDFRDWTDHDIEAFFALKLSKDKIQDCSKADGLAKAFVIIQCLWFVVQCIGRAVDGLLLIQLEVTCLAYIACNIGMYVFWWYKPLNVSCPERIQSAEIRHEKIPITAKFPWHQAIFETLVTGDIGLLIFPERGWDNDIVHLDETRFPVNYYYKHKSWGKYVEPLGQTVPMAIFGALHALAWHGSFPTLAEKILWRSSSIAPAILALVLLAYFAVSQVEAAVPPRAEKMLECIACFTIIISFAARIGFIVQPLFQFRDLPPLAFQTVEWTDIMPHV